MKKVGIITMHRVKNCGSILQAYALQQKILELGYKCEIIDYVYPNKEHLIYLNKLNSRKKSLKTFLSDRIYFLLTLKRNYKMKNFLQTNLILSKIKYESQELIKRNPPIYDLYCTGSDQVWNSRFNCNDDVFYMSFCKLTSNIFSYASSSTVKDCADENNLKYLCKYKNISVREKTSQDELQKHFGKKVQINLDPTLLIDGTCWTTLLSLPKRIIKRPYVLFYILTYSFNPYPDVEKLVSEIIKQTHLYPVFLYGSVKRTIKFGAKNILNAGPLEFFNLINNAEIVITSSFHGTCFSILQNKNFYSLVDSAQNASDERIISLLSDLGLENRILEKQEKFKIRNTEDIDYLAVNEKLQKLRESSIDYLRECLGKGAI